jgi:hypothetical protein
MKYDKPAYSFIIYEENKRAKNLKASVSKSTGFRKTKYSTQYELDKENAEKELIDEINRSNMASGYGV